MIHPEATVDECLQEIGALEREIERLRAALRAIGYDYEIVEREGAAAFARRALADQQRMR